MCAVWVYSLKYFIGKIKDGIFEGVISPVVPTGERVIERGNKVCPGHDREPLLPWRLPQKEEIMANHTMTKAELVGILLAGGINVSLYGLGKAKTLDHLLREVESGEAELRKDETGRLPRVPRVAKGEVLYRTPAGGLRLCEDRQVFTDCRERRRWAGLAPNAGSEKLA